eukprot:8313160-Pyramimonas_sp.AAC.2
MLLHSTDNISLLVRCETRLTLCRNVSDVPEDKANTTAIKWRGFAVRRGFPFNVSIEVNSQVEHGSDFFQFQVNARFVSDAMQGSKPYRVND